MKDSLLLILLILSVGIACAHADRWDSKGTHLRCRQFAIDAPPNATLHEVGGETIAAFEISVGQTSFLSIYEIMSENQQPPTRYSGVPRTTKVSGVEGVEWRVETRSRTCVTRRAIVSNEVWMLQGCSFQLVDPDALLATMDSFAVR